MGKDNKNEEYKWWEDPYLWSEDDGELFGEVEPKEFTDEEVKEIFKPITPKID